MIFKSYLFGIGWATVYAKCNLLLFRILILHIYDYLVTPCPSTECWYWNSETGKCMIRTDIDVKSCYSIVCLHDKMSVKFSSALYGIDDNNSEVFGWNNWQISDGCLPIWTGTEYAWTHELGDCDMQVGNKQVDETRLDKAKDKH